MCAPCGEIAHSHLPYHLFWRVSQYHRLNIVLTGVIIALEDGKRLVPGNRHDSLVVPPFPNFPGNEGMTEVMKAQVHQPSFLAGWSAK
jgi:hypothetical protein